VSLSTASSWSDNYSVALNAGDVVSVGLKNVVGAGTTVTLLDPFGNTLTKSSAGPTNLDAVINNFPIVLNSRKYCLRVTGTPAANYDLVVTRNAAFDTEANDSFTAAQALDGTKGVLGGITTVGPVTVVPNANTSSEGDGSNGFPFNLAAFSRAS